MRHSCTLFSIASDRVFLHQAVPPLILSEALSLLRCPFQESSALLVQWEKHEFLIPEIRTFQKGHTERKLSDSTIIAYMGRESNNFLRSLAMRTGLPKINEEQSGYYDSLTLPLLPRSLAGTAALPQLFRGGSPACRIGIAPGGMRRAEWESCRDRPRRSGRPRPSAYVRFPPGSSPDS